MEAPRPPGRAHQGERECMRGRVLAQRADAGRDGGGGERRTEIGRPNAAIEHARAVDRDAEPHQQLGANPERACDLHGIADPAGVRERECGRHRHRAGRRAGRRVNVVDLGVPHHRGLHADRVGERARRHHVPQLTAFPGPGPDDGRQQRIGCMPALDRALRLGQRRDRSAAHEGGKIAQHAHGTTLTTIKLIAAWKRATRAAAPIRSA